MLKGVSQTQIHPPVSGVNFSNNTSILPGESQHKEN